MRTISILVIGVVLAVTVAANRVNGSGALSAGDVAYPSPSATPYDPPVERSLMYFPTMNLSD